MQSISVTVNNLLQSVAIYYTDYDKMMYHFTHFKLKSCIILTWFAAAIVNRTTTSIELTHTFAMQTDAIWMTDDWLTVLVDKK